MPSPTGPAPQPQGEPEEGEGLLASLDETAALPADLSQSGYAEDQLANWKNSTSGLRVEP